MNLFVLDPDPVKAAAGLDDKRLGSALMEATMMLSVPLQSVGEIGAGMLCRPSHQHHPVTLWVGATRANWRWTLQYAQAVRHEWFLRYGSIHAAGLRVCYLATMEDCLLAGPLLPFQNSARNAGLDLDFSWLPAPESYREYLMERWKTDKRPPSYTNRGWPEWARSVR